MNINMTTEGRTLTAAVEGRLDTTTAPELEAALRSAMTDIQDVIFDFEKLEYISSAGLRVLLSAQKKVREGGDGQVIVRGANDLVKEVFAITGFCDILTVE